MACAKPFQFSLRGVFAMTALIAVLSAFARVDIGLAVFAAVASVWSRMQV